MENVRYVRLPPSVCLNQPGFNSARVIWRRHPEGLPAGAALAAHHKDPVRGGPGGHVREAPLQERRRGPTLPEHRGPPPVPART